MKKLMLNKYAKRPEKEEQKSFVKYLEMRGLLYTATMNENIWSFLGRKIAVIIASLSKAMGVKKGVPDVLIFEPRGQWHGCCVELKRIDGGKIYDEQREWIKKLQDRKYYAFIAWGKDHAIEQLEEYLQGPRKASKGQT